MGTLSREKLEYFLKDNEEFVHLNAAYKHIVKKHGSFPLDKGSYEAFVQETL